VDAGARVEAQGGLVTRRLAAYGSRLTAHGSRLTAHGSRLTAHGLRLKAHGLRLAAHGISGAAGFVGRKLFRPKPEAYEKAFNALGLKNVRIDREGNVLGERPGRLASGTGVMSPHVVFSAHLDTVFPEGTDVNVKRDGPILNVGVIGGGTSVNSIPFEAWFERRHAIE
jgi:hypothetical protein